MIEIFTEGGEVGTISLRKTWQIDLSKIPDCRYKIFDESLQ